MSFCRKITLDKCNHNCVGGGAPDLNLLSSIKTAILSYSSLCEVQNGEA